MLRYSCVLLFKASRIFSCLYISTCIVLCYVVDPVRSVLYGREGCNVRVALFGCRTLTSLSVETPDHIWSFRETTGRGDSLSNNRDLATGKSASDLTRIRVISYCSPVSCVTLSPVALLRELSLGGHILLLLLHFQTHVVEVCDCAYAKTLGLLKF